VLDSITDIKARPMPLCLLMRTDTPASWRSGLTPGGRRHGVDLDLLMSVARREL